MSTVTRYLDQRGIDFETMPHPRAVTTKEEARALGVPAGEVAKTLVVATEDGLALAVLPGSARLDLRLLREATGDGHARLATEAEIEEAFPSFELGALPPLGSLLGVPSYVDEELTTHETVVFADGFQTESVRMRTQDLWSIERVTIVPLVAHPAQQEG